MTLCVCGHQPGEHMQFDAGEYCMDCGCLRYRRTVPKDRPLSAGVTPEGLAEETVAEDVKVTPPTEVRAPEQTVETTASTDHYPGDDCYRGEAFAAQAVETLNGWCIPVEESGLWYVSRRREAAAVAAPPEPWDRPTDPSRRFAYWFTSQPVALRLQFLRHAAEELGYALSQPSPDDSNE